MIPDFRRASAETVFQAEGFTAGADGGLKLGEATGSLVTQHEGPDGRYAVALRLRDGHTGQSRVRVSAE